MPRFFALLVVFSSAPALAAQDSREVHLPEARHGLQYETPATVWDEAMPLGNGMLGALVWGDGKPLKISLDRADLWDLRPVPEFQSEEYRFETMRQWHREGRVKDLLRVYEEPYRRPAPTKIPAGRIEISLDPPFRSAALDLRTATAGLRFGDGSVSVFVHATQPVGMIRFAGRASLAARLAPPAFAGEVRDAAAGGIGAGDLRQLG